MLQSTSAIINQHLLFRHHLITANRQQDLTALSPLQQTVCHCTS